MIPSRTPSGAIVNSRARGCVEASLGGVGSLTVALEINTDCPGQVLPYFVRGGIDDNAMSVAELRQAMVVLGELLAIAQAEWPRLMKEERA